MDQLKIITNAIEYADQQEGLPRHDEWHSAYYGYIKGYQDANRIKSAREGQKGEESTEALNMHGVSVELPHPDCDEVCSFYCTEGGTKPHKCKEGN